MIRRKQISAGVTVTTDSRGRCSHKRAHGDSKRRWQTKRKAQGKWKGERPFTVYQCEGCGFWHRASRRTP